MKVPGFIVLFLLFSTLLFARHGKGGIITYEWLGNGVTANTSKYRITVTHYIDCNGTQFIEGNIFIGIFDASSSILIKTLVVPITKQVNIEKTSFGCISPQPEVCYIVITYIEEVELVNNSPGYIISEQECCRIEGILNIRNSSTYGITNSITIPGIINNIVYRNNSSPQFAQRDTVVICHNAHFMLDFSATDLDGDSLSYTFCDAVTGGSAQIRQPYPPDPPPYLSVNYQNGFSGNEPLGNGVTINAKTGIISGIAPAVTGHYVVSVCLSEYRNSVLLSVTKKEVQVEVASCNLSAAVLKTSYINCNDFSFSFQNESISPDVTSYYWDFGVPNLTTDISTEPVPTYVYPDTGHYIVKLKVANSTGCEDSTTADVIVYPGFDAGFSIKGSCYLNPFEFTDMTYAAYGTVNSWRWNFGDNTNPVDVKNPVHYYSNTGTYNSSLVVSSNKGCIDTVLQTVLANERPMLSLPFHDTLICSIDSLQLHATGTGIFSWTPAANILDANTASPRFSPTGTTTYFVMLNENGCIAKDSVKINVLDFITVSLPVAVTICQSDSIILQPVSDALKYSWSPATGLNDPTAKNPVASPSTSTTYQLIANLGKCQDQASMRVNVVPYPKARAEADTTICYASAVPLRAAISGASFTWTPTTGLQNAATLFPIARPLQTTAYVLTVYDTMGCPKPARDTVHIVVSPRINAFAGNDTTVVSYQPLQLNASGGNNYQWSPAYGLNNASIANPVAALSTATDSIIYTVRVFSTDGCYADDSLKVIVFKTSADIFVPSAFTPNNDGKNDILKPILVGMKSLESFQVFNRWGQTVFSTKQAEKGWDGKINGITQSNGTFVFLARGTTYTNEKIFRKGTVTLIR